MSGAVPAPAAHGATSVQRLLKYVSEAIGSESAIPVPPLLQLITEYACFVGRVSTHGSKNHKFGQPYSSGVETQSMFVVDYGLHTLVRYYANRMRSNYGGSTLESDGRQIAIQYPTVMCINPVSPGEYFMCDHTGVWRSRDRQFHAVVGPLKGVTDGGERIQFRFLTGMTANGNGDTLYLVDNIAAALFLVNVKTSVLSVVCGTMREPHTNCDGKGRAADMKGPRTVCFDRALTTKADSVLYVTASCAIRRVDLATGTLLFRLPTAQYRAFLVVAFSYLWCERCAVLCCVVRCDEQYSIAR